MGRINVLDKHTAELIAAGEVVERPASVIKELVENSIDAGAKNITVEIMRGGVTYIRVTDDGCGIMREDIKKAFIRHATSKILNPDDLDAISTLGFRGEALASVSSVSKVELLTLSDNEKIGSRYVVHGGDEIEFDSAGCPKGTTIIVRDIFYNVPARMKFLKKDVSEGNAVTGVVDKIALSHPEISFTYIKDGKLALKTAGDGKLLSAIYSIYGRDFAKNLVEVDYTLNGIRVWGYVSRPYNSRANRSMQNFFINNRYVRCRTAMVALEEACKGMVMVGKFPACVLHIELSFEGVDVNVHPAKTEVRFVNERPVFEAVYHGVKSALNSDFKEKEVLLSKSVADNQSQSKTVKNSAFTFDSAVIRQKKNETAAKAANISQREPQLYLPPKPGAGVQFRLSDSADNGRSIKNYLNFIDKINTISDTENKTQNCEEPENNAPTLTETFNQQHQEKDSDSEDTVNTNPTQPKQDPIISVSAAASTACINEQTHTEPDTSIGVNRNVDTVTELTNTSSRYIGEIFDTYILAQRGADELLVIDKHAAHERMIYEKLKREKPSAYSQALLVPETVLLSSSEYDVVLSNIEAFENLGFEIDDFGNSTVAVRAYPQYLAVEDIKSTVEEMAGYLLDNKKQIQSEKMDWVYHNIACRAAIKGGNKNTSEELKEILKVVESDPDVRFCPHGRPVCTVIKKSEFEKMFGRV